jgi:flagellar biosynthesis/type III secretory pathway protein FliH
VSAIIKSGSRARQLSVRPLSAVPPEAAPKSVRDEEIDALRRRIGELEMALAARDAALAEARGEIEHARRAGEAQGREAGLAEAASREAERIAALDAAIVEAQAALDAGLEATERLALGLARDCLDIVFGDGASRAAMVADVLSRQMAVIDRAMLVSIEVSEDDFSDPAALAALAARAGTRSVALIASPSMLPGGCIITLRLGEMDVGIQTQWANLRARLDELAEAAP